jgi:O-antigen/teichoic acid export membrane protein
MLDSEIVTEEAGAVPREDKGSFATDVAKLVGGTTFAQLLSMLASPILTRIYPPGAFGTAAVFTSILSIIGVITCLRYELAIMLPERDEEAANLLTLSLLIVPIIAGLSAAFVLFARDPVVRLLKAPDLASYLWLLPLAVLANGIFLALNYWNSRTKRFGRLSIAKGAQSIVTSGAQLGLGVGGATHAGGLIASKVLGIVSVAVLLGKQTWQDAGHILRGCVSWHGMVTGLKRHKKFPLYSTWSALLNSISWQLPSFLLSSFFSTSVVGYYALGTRVLRLPMSLIGNAIAQVFFQRAAEANAEGTLDQVVESSYRRLVMLGMFPLLMLTVVGRDLFVIIFGNSWAEAGVYTQILSIWTFFWFISSPLSTLYSVLERQKVGLIFNSVILSTRLISLLVGGMLGNARLSLFLFGVSGVLVYGYLSLMILIAAGVALRNVFEVLLNYFLLFLPFGAIVITIKFLGLDRWIVLAVAFILIVLYLVHVLKRDSQVRNLLIRLTSD